MDEMHRVIERLYTVFERYPFRSEMIHCPCCVKEEYVKLLGKYPLAEFPEDQIRRYAGKAITTWGDAADYKHFLPRIWELEAMTSFIGLHILISKLESGKWEEWPEEEREAITDYLMVLWRKDVDLIVSLGSKPDDDECFVYTNLYEMIKDLDKIGLGGSVPRRVAAEEGAGVG